MEPVFTAEQLAERYNVTVATITDWRYKRRGPKWFKGGKRVYYRQSAVEAWEKEREAAQENA